MITLLTVVLAFSCRAFGANDWSKACLSGSCSFDVEEGPTSMGGTIEISGSSSAISDITPSAGWQILNCTDSTNSQTIRLVCTDESSGCGHIFQNGAQDTIVRLPENCGSGPFVRVANHSISDDQSLPTEITSRLTRRGATPQVHALQIDDKFEQMSGVHGNVSFEIRAQGNIHHGVPGGEKSTKGKRQNGSGSAAEAVNIPGQTITFFNTNLTCPAADDTTQTQFMFGSVSLLQAAFNTTISVTSTGTLSPPNIESLSFSAPTDGTIAISTNFEAGLQGTLTIKGLQLGNQEFPNFSIDGVLTIDPVFVVIGDATATAEQFANFIPLNSFFVGINNLQFTYPSNSPPASVDIPAPDGPFDVLAMPVENSNAQFTFSALFQLLTEVTAFSQSVDMDLSYSYESDMSLVSTPSADNNEQVCVTITNSFEIGVANSGAFFDAFSDANSQTISSIETTPVNTCQDLPLGPAPQVTRTTRSTLLTRDGVSCPPVAALPQTSISLN